MSLCYYLSGVGEGEENYGGIIETVSDVGIAHINEVGGHHHCLSNQPSLDDVVYQSLHKVYSPCAEHVVSKDEVLIG